jgi:hypothetical protein
LISWKPRIAPQLLARRAQALGSDGDFANQRLQISDGTYQFRLKFVKRQSTESEEPMTTLEFGRLAHMWPKCLSVSVNEDYGVDFRRKGHHGVDVTTDISALLKEGENEVTAAINFGADEENLVVYYMGIELVCIADYKTAFSMPGKISAEESLSSITSNLRNLRSRSNEDDDDIVVESVLSIDLVDPFMSTMCVTPVRGRDCQHKECFDLGAFLLSRTSRVKNGLLTNPDQWKCPICKADARPFVLLVDEFLVGVRKSLEMDGKTETKAILVKEDGSWEPKVEQQVSRPQSRPPTTLKTLETPLSDRGSAIPSMPLPQSAAQTPETVVILDDD